MPSAEGIARLHKLADFLDDLKPPLFDFRSWLHIGSKEPSEALAAGGGCGTTACAVGWCPAVFPTEWEWRTEDWSGETPALSYHEEDESPDPLDDAEEFFNLDYAEAVYLFTPHDCHDEDCVESQPCKAPGHAAGPKEVAAHIRRFADLGSIP